MAWCSIDIYNKRPLKNRHLFSFFIISILLVLVSAKVRAQAEKGGDPLGPISGTKGELTWICLESPDIPDLLKEDSLEQTQGFKSLRFGKGIDGKWTAENCGTWSLTENNQKIWRVGFICKGALNTGLILSDLHLMPGERLFIYSPDLKEIRGAYDAGSGDVLSIIPLHGERIVVEWDLPQDAGKSGSFTIERVIHGYRNLDDLMRKGAESASASGSCNVDINCPEGGAWQVEKRAVAKIIINGVELCSGSLINNTSYDGRPYFLTANHCISSPFAASRSLFIFNYEHAVCNGVGGNTSQTITGAKLLATTTWLDFSLNQLGIPPPYAFNPLYLGWTTDSTGIKNTVTIHHPSGDVKKISIDNDAPVTGNFGSGYDVNSHWQILRWDSGTTEGGSSGGPLLNQDHRLIGTLTGGDANCSSSVNDYFQKFSRCWKDYSDSIYQLRYWLDPLHTGAGSVSNHEPWHFLLNSKTTLQNTLAGDTSLTLKSSSGWGYLAGHSAAGTLSFAEPFYLQDTALILGLLIRPGKIYSSTYDSYITVNIWRGGQKPDSLIYSQKTLLSSLRLNTYTEVPLWTHISLKDSLFAGFTISYLRPDTFAICTPPPRISPSDNTTMVFVDNNWKSLVDAFGVASSLDLALEIADVSWLQTPTDKMNKILTFYPNPAHEFIHYSLPAGYVGIGRMNLYSLSGKLVRTWSGGDELNRRELNVSGLQDGYYLLQYVEQGREPLIGKMIIMKAE